VKNRMGILGRYPNIEYAVRVLTIAGYRRMERGEPNEFGEYTNDHRTWEATGEAGPSHIRGHLTPGGACILRAVKLPTTKVLAKREAA
jgi:hypothetical protein